MLNDGAPFAHTPHTLESKTGARRTHRIALPSKHFMAALANPLGENTVPSVETLIARFDGNRAGELGENPDAAALFEHLAKLSMRYSRGGGSDIIVPALDMRPEVDEPNLDLALVGVREGMVAALREIAEGMDPKPEIIVMAQTRWEKPGESTGWQTTDKQGVEVCLRRVVYNKDDPEATSHGVGGCEDWNVYIRAAQRENAEK